MEPTFLKWLEKQKYTWVWGNTRGSDRYYNWYELPFLNFIKHGWGIVPSHLINSDNES